jgi:hypothetical protein
MRSLSHGCNTGSNPVGSAIKPIAYELIGISVRNPCGESGPELRTFRPVRLTGAAGFSAWLAMIHTSPHLTFGTRR